ncbi:MAG TPA: tRNA lysidine(34) synthetase TilS [Elusimicrobia bacterium]|nr:tRNA lysidine(34) synthetase TilS [Elusimicrobiota bacterium]
MSKKSVLLFSAGQIFFCCNFSGFVYNLTMFQKIKRFIDKYKMLRKNDRVLIALSGGADSVFLTVILNEVKNLCKIKLFACHINHQLRKASGKDAEFVRVFCKKLDIPVEIKKIKLKKFSEEKARDLRYKIFYEVAKKFGCNKIATGHTLNDNAETVLMWLARGCGIKGLKGIPPVRRKIIRPILCVSKKEIISYLKRNKIKHCTDSTNFSTKFTRNKIRVKIIPQLEKINPKAVQHIFELSEKLRNRKIIDIPAKKCYNNFRLKEKTVFFDAAKIDIKKIKIRKWRFGDKMVPFGMDNPKKLQDVFTDDKIPKDIRKKIPVICEGNKIIWVAGVKRSNAAKITGETKDVLKMELKNGK